MQCACGLSKGRTWLPKWRCSAKSTTVKNLRSDELNEHKSLQRRITVGWAKDAFAVRSTTLHKEKELSLITLDDSVISFVFGSQTLTAGSGFVIIIKFDAQHPLYMQIGDVLSIRLPDGIGSKG